MGGLFSLSTSGWRCRWGSLSVRHQVQQTVKWPVKSGSIESRKKPESRSLNTHFPPRSGSRTNWTEGACDGMLKVPPHLKSAANGIGSSNAVQFKRDALEGAILEFVGSIAAAPVADASTHYWRRRSYAVSGRPADARRHLELASHRRDRALAALARSALAGLPKRGTACPSMRGSRARLGRGRQ